MREQLVLGVCLLLTVCVTVSRAATIEWIADGTAESDWHDTGKWSIGRVPDALDDVVINDPGNYTIVVSSADVAVASLRVADGAENFVISLELRRRFTVAGPCTIGGALKIHGGELRLQSDVHVGGDAEFGGRLTGIGSKRKVFVQRAVATRSTFYLSNVELTVSNQFSVISSPAQNVELELGASIVVASGATATMTSASTVKGKDGTFVRNEGTFECRGSGDCYVATNFINDGNLNVLSRAQLRLDSSRNAGGVYVDRYSRLTLESGTHSYLPEAIIQIDGTLETASGATSQIAAQSFAITRVLSNGGVLTFNFSADGVVESINSIEVTKGTVQLENTDSSATSLSTDVLSIDGDGIILTSVDVKTKSLLMMSSSTYASHSGQMIVSASVVVTDRWVWGAGTVDGPGTIDVKGSVDILQPTGYSSAYPSSVYLFVSTAVINNAALFRKPSNLVFGDNTRLTITESGVVTFAAVDCSITGGAGHSILDNWGLIQTSMYYTGMTSISVDQFNNYGRVDVLSDITSTLQIYSSVILEGSFAISSENRLTLNGNVRGNRQSRIVGNGTIELRAQQAQLYNVLVPRLEVGSGTVHIASSENLLTLTNLTVSAGACTLDSDLSVEVQSLKVSGGTLNADGKVSAESVQMTSGTLKAALMTVKKEFSWTGGIVSGAQIAADTLNVYTQEIKSLENVHLVVQSFARVQGYNVHIQFSQAAILELSAGARASIIGDVTFSSPRELSTAFISHGDINIMAESFVVESSLHMYGSMTLLNSDLSLKGASTLDGDVIVSLNSSLTVGASLVMSKSSRLFGKGQLQLSHSRSSFAIQLFNIATETVRVTSGTSTISTGGNVTLIDISGGRLEMDDTNEADPVYIHRVNVSGTGSFVSQRSVYVEELTVSDSGEFEATNGGTIADHLQWISGWIKGDVFGQVTNVE